MDEYVFPQDQPGGDAGKARAGGLKVRDLATLLFTAVYILKGNPATVAISMAGVANDELFGPVGGQR